MMPELSGIDLCKMIKNDPDIGGHPRIHAYGERTGNPTRCSAFNAVQQDI